MYTSGLSRFKLSMREISTPTLPCLTFAFFDNGSGVNVEESNEEEEEEEEELFTILPTNP